MPVFEYRAKDQAGHDSEGAVEAPTQAAALDALAEHHLTPFYLKERVEHGIFEASLKIFNRVKSKDLVIFSRQLSVMASATLPLVQSLRILVKQTENETLKIIISDVADEVEGGVKLSAAMAKFPDVFSDFYVNMVRSGETSGKLDEVLNYLADEAEKNYDLMSKIRGAMIYPAFIIGGMVIVGIVMMVFVVPKLTAILKESGGRLPLSTRILIGTSDFLQHQWWLLVIILLLLTVGGRMVLRSRSGRLAWHHLQLYLPVFGNLFQKIYLTRFTRSLSTLLVGGVPLTRSLEIVAGVMGNLVYADLVEQTIREVEEGNSIATVFLQSRVMPTMVSQMLIVGEKTGRLEEVLNRLNGFYTREVENMVTRLVTLIEPLIMVVLGVAVGVIVAAIILPLYNLAGAL